MKFFLKCQQEARSLRRAVRMDAPAQMTTRTEHPPKSRSKRVHNIARLRPAAMFFTGMILPTTAGYPNPYLSFTPAPFARESRRLFAGRSCTPLCDKVAQRRQGLVVYVIPLMEMNMKPVML